MGKLIDEWINNPESKGKVWKDVKHYEDVHEEGAPLSPFTTGVKGDVVTIIQGIHNRRSRQARAADESFNAPVTTDEDKWRDNPNRYDYPGVDTIGHKVGAARAARAIVALKERGHLHSYVYKKAKSYNAAGEFFKEGKPKGKRELAWKSDITGRSHYRMTKEYSGKPEIHIYKSAWSDIAPTRPLNQIHTVAHEGGHAIDWAKQKEAVWDTKSESLYEFKYSGELKKVHKDEMVRLSKLSRGGYDTSKRDKRAYRERGTELIADNFALYVLEPRAFKRDASPEFFGEIDKSAKEILGADFRKKKLPKGKGKSGTYEDLFNFSF